MNLLKKLSGKKVFVISPHYDDAVLSCGGLMLSGGVKIHFTVVNVFTKGHSGPYTLSARKFLSLSGIKNGIKLFSERKKEDLMALSKLKVISLDLGLVDALFRRSNKSLLGKFIPELDHLYPIYKMHVLGKVNKKDAAVLELKKKLSILPKNSIVLVPFGIGGHVDHVITRQVCESMFKNCVLYSDFPYNFRKGSTGDGAGFTKVEKKVNLKKKSDLVAIYKSQFNGLFGGGLVPRHSEYYFFRKTK